VLLLNHFFSDKVFSIADMIIQSNYLNFAIWLKLN
jgi:hypothetical protein